MVKAGRREISVSNPEKVMFPGPGIAKARLVEHYAACGPAMTRLVGGHPLVMNVFPRGISAPGFYLKNTPEHFPGWIRTQELVKRGGTVNHVVAGDSATPAYLANQNSVEIHAWLSRVDKPTRPDRIVFDLDPPGPKFAEVRATARELGALLRDRGLDPFVMTTGSRGLHVVVAISRRREFPKARDWALEVARELVGGAPRRLTVEFLKEKREGRIFVDVNRNAYAQHAVAPYSVRARDRAPVAAPLRWDELDDRKLKADGFTIATIGERLDDDPWSGF